MREYQLADDEARTLILKEIANELFEVRQHFFNRDGETDWLGRSYAYREWVRETAQEAGLETESRQRLLTAARYHIANIQREKLSAETLQELGLTTTSAKERNAKRREEASSLLSRLVGTNTPTSTKDFLEIAGVIDSLLRRVSPETIRDLSPKDRERVNEAFAAVGAAATELSRATKVHK